MAVEIRVLGRVDAIVDGRSLPVKGGKQRAVLAMLALRSNRAVGAGELIDGLWGERPPASAAKNVQYYVSQLRKALASDDSGATIVTRGRGYELQLPDDAVDAARFERLVERARAEAERGIVDGSARGALELWRGTPLADVAEEPFAGAEIRRLEELHLRALELAIDAELAAGRHDDAIGRLETLIAEHPAHERFHAQRMLALYRAGRQSEAVEGYRAAHRTLSEQIGVEPGPELARLQEQILAHDPALDARPAPELPRQLEGGSPLLAGRDRELRWLRRRWAEAEEGRTRIALLSGSPGIGKTRLAAELAAAVQPEAAVLYAAGSGAPDAALEAIRGAKESELPTLVVLDDADDASPAVLEAAVTLAAKPRDTPLLLLVLHRDDEGPPAFAAAAHRLALRPLRVEAAAEIAELYAPADGVAMPVETLMAESEGVPLRVHRAASGWAQAQAAEQLEAASGQAVVDHGGLRTARAKLAGSVTDLQLARERTSLYVVAEPSPPAEPEVCPFRGLAPFDSAHAEYFFGRERLVADLVARLVGSTLIAVVGPSGSGKSSVLRAGLLPALADGVLPGSERWRQVVMRPGEHPLAELDRALARVASDEGAQEADNPIAAALDSLAPDEHLVLAVDQLEEIFTACRDETERAAFTNAVVALAADADQRVVVVLGIRGDYYGRCAMYAELSERMSANNVLVGPMRRDELRRAIELPARRAGLWVEPSLVAALIGDVADEPGGLPLLSTTLLELWKGRSGRTLREASYAASGRVSGAVARLAERAYRRLTEPQRERARAILLRLADAEQPAPVRRRVPLEELEAERDEDTTRVLAVLTESRLVSVDEGAVEVAHEALLSEWPRLRGWLEEDAEGRRLHQHLIHAAAEWEHSGRDPAELYRGARLASALDWASTHERELNERERALLEESRVASEREAERQRRTNRRLRALLAGVGVLLAAAVVAGAIALSERQGARSAATVADAERLGAQALTEEHLDQALRLASAGLALDDSVATRSSLLSTLLRSPAAIGVLRTDGFAHALSPDGGTLAVHGDGTVTLFDTETHEVVGDHQAPGTAYHIEFDPQGDSLALSLEKSDQSEGYATGTATGTLEIRDAASGRLRSSTSLGRRRAPAGQGISNFGVVNYAPDGRSLIVLHHRGSAFFLRRYDARRGTPLGKPVRFAAPAPCCTGLPMMSPDGRLLFTSDRAIVAIDAETFRVIRRYPVGAEDAALSPDGRTLAIAPPDGGLRLLDLASGRVRTLTGRQDQLVGPRAFSPDGRTLSTSEDGGSVILWDVKKGVTTETLEGHAGVSEWHAFSPDGRTLYTAGAPSSTTAGSGDGRVIVWDVAGDRRLGRPFPTEFRSPFGAEASILQVEHGESAGRHPAFALSPDGRALAAARHDGRVELIDAETLRRTASFEAFPGMSAAAIRDQLSRTRFGSTTDTSRAQIPKTPLDYSADGRRLAVAGQGGGVGVWDVESKEQVGALLRAPRGPRTVNRIQTSAIARSSPTVQGLAFGQGDLLAAAEVGGAVRIWDVGRRELLRAPLRLPRSVLGLAFSPDGSQLAIPFGAFSAKGPNGVEILDVGSGERVARLSSDGEVRSVAFSPDGSLLAGAKVEGGALLWATDGWRQVGRPLALPDETLEVAFSPDGHTLATSHAVGTVALWDVASQEPIGPPLPGTFAVQRSGASTARFTPDGSRLFVLSAPAADERRLRTTGAIRWEVDPDLWLQRACTLPGGGLTPEQWAELVPEQDYRPVCPSG